MRNKKHVEGEIKRLRQAMKLSLPESEKEKLWCSMLSLQWALSNNSDVSIGPLDICLPYFKRVGMDKLMKRKAR